MRRTRKRNEVKEEKEEEKKEQGRERRYKGEIVKVRDESKEELKRRG